MKTLKLYIDGVKCEFEGGHLVYYPETLKDKFIAWYKKNIEQIQRYRSLTSGNRLYIPPDSLRFGHLGNGVTVYTTAYEENNDYLILAHISPERKVAWYFETDRQTFKKVEHFAAHSNMKISATQNINVFNN